MAHSVGDQAARAVKNSQKKAVETRTVEQRLVDIRKNLAAHLFVIPDDQKLLVELYDQAQAAVTHLAEAVKGLLSRAETAEAQYQEAVKIITARNHEVATLQEKIAEFRAVYDQENRSTAIEVERSLNETDKVVFSVTTESNLGQLVAPGIRQTVQDIADLGGEA